MQFGEVRTKELLCYQACGTHLCCISMKIVEALWCFNMKIHMQHFLFPSYLLEILDWVSVENISHPVM